MSSVPIFGISNISSSLKLRDPTLLAAIGDDDSSHHHHQEKQHGVRFPILNPAATYDEIKDGSSVIATLESMVQADARMLIEKSSDALLSWRDKTTGLKRSQILSRWSELVKENAHDIAQIMTLESGKPLNESIGEIAYGTSFLDYYAAEAMRSNSAGGGSITPTPFSAVDGSPRGKILAIQEAVGVTAMITPWNFPIAMITRKVGPALAAGCTVLLKPSDLTPLTAIAVQRLAFRAGLPQDVFQLIITDRDHTPEVGNELCTNPIVKKISFTGSTAVGKQLMKIASDTVKRLSLELGGNAPFIVFDDADLQKTIQAALTSKFRNAGQTCVCADRFLVHESLEEEFTSRLVTEVNQFRIGLGITVNTDGTTNPNNNLGPLISDTAVQSVKEKVEEAIAEGADCVIGGSTLPNLGPNFFQPTVLRNVSPSSRIWKEETFGPVIAITTFGTEEEAVHLANDTTTGLASYIFSQDMDRIFRVGGRLENGMVGVNEGIISTATAPFGGVKESGLGREGSSVGIAEYLETKYMFINS
eukprot:CAMPEP_0195539504 /NCGR_PEP_ID=MMETSP0794_2-20130614/50089_1 /TAXON_ID=515487 /ORGANISM="Stephanopyxis turris, Strain CCMP 815" /LENGTH=531 /DNA_ID=CAMNT_0040673539 /DNA_START=87 /DNA_END=1682 /DNA_ORIENTATION=-